MRIPNDTGPEKYLTTELLPQIPKEKMSSTDIHSIMDFLPESVRHHAKNIPQEYFSMTEAELKEICYPKEDRRAKDGRLIKTSYDIDQKLRTAFWIEFEAARNEQRRMQLPRCVEGVMHLQNFLQRVMVCPKRLAWILHPPLDYRVSVEDLLNRGIRRLYEIVEMPLKRKLCRCHYFCVCNQRTARGAEPRPCACLDKCKCPATYDVKTAEVILKTYERIELRARGSIPQVMNQNIMQRTLSVNVNQNSQHISNGNSQAALPHPESQEDLEKKLLELRAKMNAITGQSAVPANQNLDSPPPNFPERREFAEVIEGEFVDTAPQESTQEVEPLDE